MTDLHLLTESPQPLVLLGNDQEWSARSLESLLVPAGLLTIRAYTGAQLLHLAATRAVDAILVDRTLPDMCGTEAVTRLRGLPGFDPATPIVLLTTGTPSRLQQLEAYRAGAWDLLAEPWDVEAMLLKLSIYLQAKRGTTSLR